MIGITDEDKEKIIAWASERRAVRRVYLFGSRARGNHRPDSDVDLAIEMLGKNLEARYGSWMFWDDENKKGRRLILPYPVQLEWYDPEDVTLEIVGPAVRTDGILVYERV
tara:strand:- start:1279 stop:1608 length:330 start_codon:yes stop_codon:yes gene_type:complete